MKQPKPKKERTKVEGDGAPVVPSDIYYVKVWRKVPNSNIVWIPMIDQKTSAQSPLGAMRGILEAETAKEMLRNQKAIDEA
jgi:hypothetical protein